MNMDQLCSLASNKIFTIGLHTHSHSDLKGKNRRFQLKEIVTCSNILRDDYNIQTNVFAYPYGNYDNDTLDVVSLLGLSACFTTAPGPIVPGDDKKRLSRYQVFDIDPIQLSQLISN